MNGTDDLVMVSMDDVLANVLDDPFKECVSQFSKLCVCYKQIIPSYESGRL